jgi:hypothetical protein
VDKAFNVSIENIPVSIGTIGNDVCYFGYLFVLVWSISFFILVLLCSAIFMRAEIFISDNLKVSI